LHKWPRRVWHRAFIHSLICGHGYFYDNRNYHRLGNEARIMKNLVALLAGLIFGVGLAASGMTDTQKVLGFLDIFGDWQADLLFVMGAAVLVTVIAFRFVLKRQHPILDVQFHLPTGTHLDKRLMGGAAIFGIGWGVYGYCPGPAIATLAYLQKESLIFVGAMIVGMVIVHVLQLRKMH
jgi:uncharacterized protein